MFSFLLIDDITKCNMTTTFTKICKDNRIRKMTIY